MAETTAQDEDDRTGDDNTRTQDKEQHAPDPDDARKPDSPDDLTKASWLYVLRKTAREFSADQCTDLAAALTYYAVLSLFPALLVLVSLLGVLGQGQRTVDALLEFRRLRGESQRVCAWAADGADRRGGGYGGIGRFLPAERTLISGGYRNHSRSAVAAAPTIPANPPRMATMRSDGSSRRQNTAW